MKAQINIKPFFVTWPWLCKRLKIGGITILWWVFCEQLTKELSDRFRRHETIHSWQQTALFIVGLIACAAVSLVLGVLGKVTPWWVWTFPLTVPLVIYVLVWLVEVILPPYDRAYYDSPFEREAYMNEGNPDYRPGLFSVWKYFKRKRKFWEGK